MTVLPLLQEVTKQLPKSAHYRSLLAKQWTDCTYLDVSPAQEKINDDSRRQFNTTAMEHAKEVSTVSYLSSSRTQTVCYLVNHACIDQVHEMYGQGIA